MFTPEIAKKITYLLDSNVERELGVIFDDLIVQTAKKIKANSTDLDLRVAAVRIDLLSELKNYRSRLEDSVKRHGS